MKKRFKKLSKSVIVVILYLIVIPPIIALAADVTIISTAPAYSWDTTVSSGIYWASTDDGYAIYEEEDGGDDGIWYKKTTNGGASWGSATKMNAGDFPSYSTWADWNTPSDTGTKIHIVDIYYVTPPTVQYLYLDTYNDTTYGVVTVETTGCTLEPTMDYDYAYVSITKSVGGELSIAYMYDDDVGGNCNGFEISEDGGNTWAGKTSVFEGSQDYVLLFPANLSDPDDIWAVFWDRSTDELSLKTYDASANTWDEDLISANMTDEQYYLQFDGDIRHSDGHLILSAWTEFNTANATLKVWDIEDGDNIVELTDITTGGNMTGTGVFVDQTTNIFYVTYLKGNVVGESMSAKYQYSNDGGATWSGELSYGENAGDFRNIQIPGMKASLGANFMPYWIEEGGSTSDVKTSTVNTIEITAYSYEDADPGTDPAEDYEAPNIAEPIRNDVPGVGFPTHWFGCEDHDFSTMPVYDAFSSVSTEMGIPIENLYLLGILGIAFGVFLLIVMYVRSALLGSIAFNMVLVFGAMMCVLPLWIPFAAGVTQAGIMFMYKQVAY